MLAWAKSLGSTCQGHFKPSENTTHFIGQHLICHFLACQLLNLGPQ